MISKGEWIMKCKKCGTEFEEGIFCPECGERYISEEKREVEDNVETEEVKNSQPEQETEKQNEREKKVLETGDPPQYKDEKVVINNQNRIIPQAPKQDENDRARREQLLISMAEKAEKKNTLGVVSLILSIIGLVTTFIVVGIVPDVISLILSVVALSKKGKKKKAATAGLIISLIGTAIWIAEAVILGL